MASSNSSNSSYNSRVAREGGAQTYTTPVIAVPFEASALDNPPGAGLKGQGTRAHVRDAARSVSVSIPVPTSLSSPSSATSSLSPLSDDDLSSSSDSEYEADETVLPPSYFSLYRGEHGLASPTSSISTSPTDSFTFGKTRAAAPLLSPPYVEADPLGSVAPTPSILSTLFPAASAAVHALPATSVQIDDLVGQGWQGSVVHDAATGLRTLYVAGGKLEDLELREAVMDVIDRAEEQWGVNGVVLAVRKDVEDLGSLVHGLTYVGFTVQHKPEANPDMLLLALDLV
ncbi:hypothetical protein JCM8097_004674 [Rhodosporidiobolus ruineniae]